jgi:hypothetical protein
MKAPIPDNEAQRLAALREYHILDTAAEQASDLGFLRKGAGSARKLSSREMDLLPLAGQEGDRA